MSKSVEEQIETVIRMTHFTVHHEFAPEKDVRLATEAIMQIIENRVVANGYSQAQRTKLRKEK